MSDPLPKLDSVQVVSKVHVNPPVVVGKVEFKLEVVVLSYWRRDKEIGILEQKRDHRWGQWRICQIGAWGD